MRPARAAGRPHFVLRVLAAAFLAAAALPLHPALAQSTVLPVPWFGQVHPLDCEAASLQMLLAYQGISVSQDQILAAMGADTRAGYYDSQGRLRWGNAYQLFVGQVNGSEVNLTGYGTYWPVVARVANQLGGGTVYQAGAGISPSTVYGLVAAGHPVETWITFDWASHPREDYLTFDGSTWIPYAGPVEHAVDVVGVSDTQVLVNDPDGGKGIPGHNYPQQYWVNKSTFEASYGVYGDMAVATGHVPDNPVVSACGGDHSITVSWGAPNAYGAPLTGFTVTMNPGGTVQQVGASSRLLTYTGLSPGTSYSFTVTATDLFGTSAAGSSASLMPSPSAPTATSYFGWYDLASPGMASDNLHLLARPGGSTASTGCATVPGMAVAPFAVVPGQEQVLNFPPGTIGGPIAISLYQGNQVLASQRVQYHQSFNEVPAAAGGAAATELQFAWYDRISSPGFQSDNIHVWNPGSSTASVTVHIPGSGCSDQSQSLNPGQEDIFSCASGYGGPVTVSATQPVLASQRVQYYQSFNEEWGEPASAAASSMQFSWYDRISSPGFQGDNIHVWNPAGGAFNATARIPGCASQVQSVAAGGEAIFTCSRGFGGPVTITGSVPVLAAQRVQYYQSFNEVPAATAAKAGTILYSAWFDRISSPGFRADNIHVWNPAGTAFSVDSQIPGCAVQSLNVAAGEEGIFTCASGFGGPVVVTSTTPVLAAQRVQFYQSFNEALSES